MLTHKIVLKTIKKSDKVHEKEIKVSHYSFHLLLKAEEKTERKEEEEVGTQEEKGGKVEREEEIEAEVKTRTEKQNAKRRLWAEVKEEKDAKRTILY